MAGVVRDKTHGYAADRRRRPTSATNRQSSERYGGARPCRAWGQKVKGKGHRVTKCKRAVRVSVNKQYGMGANSMSAF